MSAGQSVRILDAIAINVAASIENQNEPRLLDFLEINDPRVLAHLQATIAGIVLKAKIPPEGVDAEWFAEDGDQWRTRCTLPVESRRTSLDR